MVHLTSKLTEDQRLFIGVTFNHSKQGIHLPRSTDPKLRFRLSLFSDTIVVHLWPDATLSRTKKTLQEFHIFGTDVGRRLEDFSNSLLGIFENIFVEASFFLTFRVPHFRNDTRGCRSCQDPPWYVEECRYPSPCWTYPEPTHEGCPRIHTVTQSRSSN